MLPVKRCQSPISTARSSPSGSLADAGAFGERFFSYYNHNHRHCGSGCTPRLQCNSAPRPRSARYDSRPSTPRTQLTPSALGTADHNHQNCPPSPGLTSHHSRPSYRPRDKTRLNRLDTFRSTCHPFVQHSPTRGRRLQNPRCFGSARKRSPDRGLGKSSAVPQRPRPASDACQAADDETGNSLWGAAALRPGHPSEGNHEGPRTRGNSQRNA